MDITLELEQIFASAVRYVQNHAGYESAPYFDDIPEGFVVPSLYFPVPRTSTRKVTLSTYLLTIHMDAWFMAPTDWMAYSAAATVRDCILMDCCKMEVIEKDGALSGKAFRVTEPETAPVDTGVVRLSFGIENYFSKESDPPAKATNVCFSGFVKPDALYEAWIEATREQRLEEEAQKKCLEKAMQSL